MIFDLPHWCGPEGQKEKMNRSFWLLLTGEDIYTYSWYHFIIKWSPTFFPSSCWYPYDELTGLWLYQGVFIYTQHWPQSYSLEGKKWVLFGSCFLLRVLLWPWVFMFHDDTHFPFFHMPHINNSAGWIYIDSIYIERKIFKLYWYT